MVEREWERSLKDLRQRTADAIQKAFNEGYNEGRRQEQNRQAARERNGGTDPDYHQCPFCGEHVANGYTHDNKRHWLSDCRPDLVPHEIGDACTWAYRRGQTNADGVPYKEQDICYAYREDIGENPAESLGVWTNEHTHFMEDGPM